MRALLLLLLAIAPAALAQAPAIELVELDIVPFEDFVRPLQGPVTTTMTTRVSCALAEGAGGVAVSYRVARAPAWATVVVSPSTDAKGVDQCEAGWATFEASLVVTASDQAPAYAPAALILGADAGGESAEAETPLAASYFSILDVQLPETTIAMAPGSAREATLKLTNFGNARTRVTTELVPGDADVRVTPPEPVVLGSKQAGGNDISQEVSVRFEAPEERGFVNRVEAVTLRLVAAHAGDPPAEGDTSTVSFLLTIRSGTPAAERDASVPAPPFAAALVVAALLGRAWLRR